MFTPASAAPVAPQSAIPEAAMTEGNLLVQVHRRHRHWHHHRHCRLVCHGHLHWRHGHGFATAIGTAAATGIERATSRAADLKLSSSRPPLVAPAFFCYAAAPGAAGMYCARVST